ncbi:beta-galactosidase [Pontibacter beigongshangensis]|uniref:beta-galactosidase n=1 Tax=Pontibacter beigongshangensis TaxID=2574733 RepID=UPI0016508C73|nr:beta-galactosidase [Pontibacter beigongshangensis]
MRKVFFLCLLILTAFTGQAQELKGTPGTFTLGNKEFLLNGKPFIIRAAELHYPRIPKAYWEHRIQLSKAMGMNTICIYLFWNLHEQQEGVFDFKGQNDIAEFVRLVQKNGMYCIVRPGPYVCAEWDMGGLPWWLLKKEDVQVRTLQDPYFMERTKKFLSAAAKELAPLQIQNGGNIIMVQVENEYATFGEEQAYMEATRDAVRTAGFDKVQLFRCDWPTNFNRYQLDGVATTLNFGAGSNVEDKFKVFQELNPTAPLMCSEYWSGWFDHWGRPHETRSISSFIGSLKDMMDRRISFSLYMAHGGTSFGQWGGANAPPYSAMATSYDYNAPIGEQGNTTDKFFAVRNLLKNYLQPGEILGEIPEAKEIIEIPTFELNQSAGLFVNLPAPKKSETIQPMENFDQGWGRILYRATIPASAARRKLVITELHDWAAVFVNGQQIGKLDRRRGDNTVELPPLTTDAQLDILVEATGRVNYGKAIIDRKGITEKVELTDGKTSTEIKNWLVYNFPVDYEFQKKAKFKKGTATGPGWYKGTFKLTKTGDTFLDVSSWGKGMVWVNGHNLGRFWKIGPQQTLYIPGVWLKKGKNEIIILDVDKPEATRVAGLREPILDELRPDESLLHRAKGEELDLSGEVPAITGSFSPGNGWQEVQFQQTQQGRYLCFEALNAQQANDPLASMAELELLDEKGNQLSRLKWKVVYADSEEITAANHAADKVYDQQESTFWQTQTVGGKPKHPHQVVIDLGEVVKVKGFRYLPRSDKSTAGMIKDYRVFLKESPFKL